MVLCSGAFDGLHAGQVRYLEVAKSLCRDNDELLVCAVASDQYIQAAKGRAAYWSQADRVYTVRALMVVDAVIAQAQGSVAAIISEYRPRILVKGLDWKDRLPEDVLLACQQTGTAIAYVDTPGRHTSEARG